MPRWVTWLLVAAGLLVASWAALVVLAGRLPPGPLRELARFIPDCLTAIGRLRGDPRVPRRAKVAVVLAGLWVASPIDLLPEFLPVIGPLDDVVVVALALRYAARQVPRQVLLDAWPGDPRSLERLLGPAPPGRASRSELQAPRASTEHVGDDARQRGEHRRGDGRGEGGEGDLRRIAPGLEHGQRDAEDRGHGPDRERHD
jgi:uncharacterized membrane protein YkvA (DUF1232 family)